MKIKQMMAVLLTAVMTVSSLPMGSLQVYAAENEPAIESVADPANESDEAITDGQSEGMTTEAVGETDPSAETEEVSESVSEDESSDESSDAAELTESADEEAETETETVTSEEESTQAADTKEKIAEEKEEEPDLLYLTVAEKTAYEAAAADVINKIAGYTDVEEKLLYIHDYLITNCEVDRTNTVGSNTAYAALVGGAATGKGYALAFQDLATKIGVPTDLVYSKKVGYYWNRVKINNKYYYVDASSDDLIGYYGMCCAHNNFLVNREELNTYRSTTYKDENGNYIDKSSDDWTVDGKTVFGTNDSDTGFSSGAWRAAEYSPLAFFDGYFLYLDTDNDYIKKYSFDTDASVELCGVGDNGWGEGGIYGHIFATIVTDGMFTFINDSCNIYLLKEDEGNYSLEKLNSADLASGNDEIYGIRLNEDDEKIEYWVASSHTGDGTKSELSISDIVGGVVRVTLSPDSKLVQFTGPNQTKQLTCDVRNSNGAVTWTSSDPTVAEVDEHGKVTSIKNGKATIEAKVGTTTDTCTVWVDTTWQKEYEYETNGDNIILTKYKGSTAILTVPDFAYDSGSLKHTVIGYTQVGTTATPVFKGNTKIKEIRFEPGVKFFDDEFSAAYAFSGCTNLTYADLSGLDFSNVTTTYGMFSGCTKLTTAKLTDCDMSKVSEVGFMFKNCSKLEMLDLQGCKMNGVSAIVNDNQYMLNGCSALKDIMTPASINNSAKITLSKAMVEYKDNKPGTTEYKNLAKAPVNSRLILKASTPKTDLKEAEYKIVLEKTEYGFTGSDITPDVKVTSEDGTVTLKKGTDYILTFENNKNPGTANIYVAGTGAYKGTLTGEFEIVRGLQDISVDLPTTTLTLGKTMTVAVKGAKTNVTYSVSPASVATIDAHTGVLKAEGLGTATVTVSCEANAQYSAATAMATLEIIDKPEVSAPVFATSPAVIKVESGTNIVERNTLVTLSTDVAGADIYYTLDGTDPDEAAFAAAAQANTLDACATKKYAGGITIDSYNDVTIKAKAYKEGYKSVDPVTKIYKAQMDWGDLESDPDLKLIKSHITNEMLLGHMEGVPKGLWVAFKYKGTVFSIETNPIGGGYVHSCSYTGDKITFNDDIIILHGNRRLVENRDYTISYTNNLNVGYYDNENVNKRPAVTIKGKGDYNNSLTYNFTIHAVDIDSVDIVSESTVTVTPGTILNKVVPSVSYNGHKLTAGKDFIAKYYVKEGDSLTEITTDAKKTKFEAGKEYAVKITDGTSANFRPHEVNEPKTDYVTVKVIDKNTQVQVSTLKTGDSRGKAIKVAYSGVVTDASANADYYEADGSVIIENLFGANGKTPLAFVYVKKASEPLAYDTDYTVEAVGDPNDAGKYTAIIHGTGTVGTDDKKYVGDKKITFEITGIPASKVKVAGLMTTAQYDGKAFTTVGDIVDSRLFNSSDKTAKAENWTNVTLYTATGSSKTPLIPGTDYSTHIGNATHMGKVDVIFTLKGKYSGTIKKTVTIKACDLAKGFASKRFTCSYSGGTVEYDAIYSKGGARIPGVVVRDTRGTADESDDKLLTEGIDYTLSYKNDTVITPGTMQEYEKLKSKPTVTIKGKGNYTGSKGFWYRISKAELTKDNVTITVSDKVYKKKATKNYFKVTPVFTDGVKNLTAGKNKDITVSDTKYYYAEDCTLDNGTERFAGQEIPASDVVPAGAVIRVTCKVQVTGEYNSKSNYKEMADPIEYEAAYRILPAGNDIGKAKVSVKKDSKAKLTYGGGYNVPMSADDFELKLGGKALSAGTYKISSVKNNRYIGTATVVFEGLNPYGGTKTYTFKIGAKSLK